MESRFNPDAIEMESCEPYEMDFGDREFMDWLHRGLTPLEQHDRSRAWDSWIGLYDRLRWVPYWLRGLRTLVLWRRRRRLDAFDRLCEARIGPAPVPQFRVRMEFGTAPREPVSRADRQPCGFPGCPGFHRESGARACGIGNAFCPLEMPRG